MTPLYDSLRERAARQTVRFHMPGHGGRSLLAAWQAPYDIDFTELSDTGNLYADGDDGPIRAAERLYADRYGAGDCLFLTGGATQGVLAMLSAFASPGDTVILDRNCHFSAHNALALLDLRPVWIRAPLIEPFSVPSGLPPDTLAAALETHPDAACVLVVSPGYYGVSSDLSALAAVCRPRGVPLLVDAAHGAHLPFLSGFSSPVALGASAAVSSAHKTLPALGQSAFLLTSAGVSASLLRRRAALFGSSSPSYVLMASLDAARAYMDAEGRDALRENARRTEQIRQSSPFFLGFQGYNKTELSAELDPLRLCAYVGDGFETAERLEKDFGVVCEMADRRNVVFLVSALHAPRDMSRLEAALAAVLSGRSAPPAPTLREAPPLPPTSCSPRQALFGRQTDLPFRDALGRVAAQPVGPYPPGTPLLARGEIVDADAVRRLEQTGFEGAIRVSS